MSLNRSKCSRTHRIDIAHVRGVGWNEAQTALVSIVLPSRSDPGGNWLINVSVRWNDRRRTDIESTRTVAMEISLDRLWTETRSPILMMSRGWRDARYTVGGPRLSTVQRTASRRVDETLYLVSRIVQEPGLWRRSMKPALLRRLAALGRPAPAYVPVALGSRS
jgi:hypothetical protein